MRDKARLFVRGLFLACTGAIAGCSPEVIPPSEEAPKVSVMHPIKRELSDYETFNGWTAADQTVEVRSRVRGHIHKIHFSDGDTVKKGQLLFELDPRPFKIEHEVAKSKIKIYQAQKVAAEKDENRLRELEKKGGASKAQVEKAEADVLSLNAQIASGENDIERTRLDWEEYSRIKAEIGGRVSEARLTEGNLVNAGGSDPLLTTIVSIDPIRVYFNVDERSLLRYGKNLGVTGKTLTDLLAGMKEKKAPFTFALDGEKSFDHQGTISFGDNQIDPTTGTLMFYGTVSNKDGKFLSRARVRVRVQIGKSYPGLLVPDAAILADQDKRYVLIIDDKNTVRRRNVALMALTDDGLRAIQPEDRLAEGEQVANWWVAVDNLQRARINYPVDPVKQ